MKKLTPEQIGLDFEALLALIGKERALDLIDEEQVLEHLLRRQGEEQVLEHLLRRQGEEQVLENLLRRQGEPWLREQLERRAQSSDEPETT